MADFDFSRLPEELIHLVMERLDFVGDFIRFGATCKSVASSARAQTHNNSFAPALMLVNDYTDAQNLRTFSCLSTKREITVTLPDIRDRRCWGSPYGWLITFGLDFHFHLLNPFTGVRLQLPPESTFPKHGHIKLDPEHGRQVSVQRLSLSSNPSLRQNNLCIVIAVRPADFGIIFCKPGDKFWTPIETPTGYFADAIYFRENIYAIDLSGILTVCDVHAHPPKGIHIGTTPLPNKRRTSSDECYLLDLCGELHVVVRVMKSVEDPTEDDNFYLTEDIFVYKFDFQTTVWIAVTDLGDHAIFVGNNTSFAISTKYYPNYKRNAIYFTDDQSQIFLNNFCDMFVYNLEEKTREPFYTGANVISKYSRPIFIVPGL